MKKEPISFEQFKKTIFYTDKYIRIPFVNQRLDKVDYMKNGKYDHKAIDKEVFRIYMENRDKLV